MELPLFPLHMVLFPGRPLPLHLFEPRYLEMLDDCLAADRRFGVVAIRSGREVGGRAEIFHVGTIAEIQTVERLPDQRSNIISRGVQRFRVRTPLDGTSYFRAEVELLDDPVDTPRTRNDAGRLRDLLLPYLTSLGAPEELLERVPSDPVPLGYLAAAVLQVELPQQQRLLELDTVDDLIGAALGILRRETSLMRHFGTVGSLKPAGPGGAELN